MTIDLSAIEQLADTIQERKHVAGMNSAKCARDAEWDLEAYWRARSEGLSEAEKIVRASLAVFTDGEA